MAEEITTHKVQINYKTGKSIVMTVTTMKVTVGEDAEITEVQYSALEGHIVPLHLGINQIESIWQLETQTDGS